MTRREASSPAAAPRGAPSGRCASGPVRGSAGAPVVARFALHERACQHRHLRRPQHPERVLDERKRQRPRERALGPRDERRALRDEPRRLFLEAAHGLHLVVSRHVRLHDACRERRRAAGPRVDLRDAKRAPEREEDGDRDRRDDDAGLRLPVRPPRRDRLRDAHARHREHEAHGHGAAQLGGLNEERHLVNARAEIPWKQGWNRDLREREPRDEEERRRSRIDGHDARHGAHDEAAQAVVRRDGEHDERARDRAEAALLLERREEEPERGQRRRDPRDEPERSGAADRLPFEREEQRHPRGESEGPRADPRERRKNKHSGERGEREPSPCAHRAIRSPGSSTRPGVTPVRRRRSVRTVRSERGSGAAGADPRAAAKGGDAVVARRYVRGQCLSESSRPSLPPRRGRSDRCSSRGSESASRPAP